MDQSNIRRVSSSYNIQVGTKLSFKGSFVIGQYVKAGQQLLDREFVGAINEMRIWSYVRSSTDVANNAFVRLYHPWDGLRLTGTFDDISETSVPYLF